MANISIWNIPASKVAAVGSSHLKIGMLAAQMIRITGIVSNS